MCGAERRVRHDLYERANTTSAASSLGRAVGHEAQTGTMILALAMRHSVERPAIRMGGGTNDPMERLARRRLDFAFEKITVNLLIRTTAKCGFCRFSGLSVRRKLTRRRI